MPVLAKYITCHGPNIPQQMMKVIVDGATCTDRWKHLYLILKSVHKRWVKQFAWVDRQGRRKTAAAVALLVSQGLQLAYHRDMVKAFSRSDVDIAFCFGM